jgi:hypothetical protein
MFAGSMGCKVNAALTILGIKSFIKQAQGEHGYESLEERKKIVNNH